MAERERQILVAGVGNSWLSDDGFGSEVVKRLGELKLPDGVNVLDFGTGGLDLAYEVMRGYDALLLIDVSKQGGEPGTLYVIDPNDEEIKPIDDGETVNPHGMDPHTVLRFIKTIGGSPGKVTVIACEPAEVEEMGLSLTPEVQAAVGRAVDLTVNTIAELQTDAAYEEAGA